jgi:hypothetical protein
MSGWRKRTIMEMARETKLPYDFVTGEPLYAEKLEAFAELIRADEREACAKVCDELANDENTDEYINAADWCAVRIRARGQA